MDREQLKADLAAISALADRSRKVTLDLAQREQFQAAIQSVRTGWDREDEYFRKANFLCNCADLHLSAITASPPRPPNGVSSLIEDCRKLGLHLDSVLAGNTV